MRVFKQCVEITTCPAIIENQQNRTYIIVGKIYMGLDVAELVGEGEEAVEIPASLVEEFLRRNG